MSRVAAKLGARQRFREVDGGDLVYRVRKVVSRDLVDRGFGLVLAAAAPARREQRTPQATIAAIRESAEYLAALVVAGVVAIRPTDDEAWEDWRIVADEADEDHAAGKLWIGSIPADVVAKIGQAVMEFSGGGEGAAALSSFLGAGLAATRQPRP